MFGKASVWLSTIELVFQSVFNVKLIELRAWLAEISNSIAHSTLVLWFLDEGKAYYLKAILNMF